LLFLKENHLFILKQKEVIQLFILLNLFIY